jgi:formate dehydrogenase subunit gamma
MTNQDIEKYSLPVRILHWLHTGAFIILFLTGLVLFIPSLGVLAQNSWIRILHRVTAIVFIAGPALYLIISPRKAARGLKQAFTGSRRPGCLGSPALLHPQRRKSMPPGFS